MVGHMTAVSAPEASGLPTSSRFGGLLARAVLLLAYGCAGMSLAAVPMPAPSPDDWVEEPAAAGVRNGRGGMVQPGQGQQVHDLGQNFDANVFAVRNGREGRGASRRPPNGERPGTGSGPEAVLSRLEPVRQRCQLRLAGIDGVCGLTESQRRRLQFAIDCDLVRLAEDIDGVRRKYAGVRVDLNDAVERQRWQRMNEDVQASRQRIEQLSGDDSLFAKAVRQVLEPEQEVKLAAELQARRDGYWQAIVATTMVQLHDLLGLRRGQHEAIEKILLEKVPPLRLDGATDQHLLANPHVMVSWVVSAGDQKRLRAAVTPAQWRELSRLAAQGKQMRQHLVQQGVLER
jgi:hypothetical protein